MLCFGRFYGRPSAPNNSVPISLCALSVPWLGSAEAEAARIELSYRLDERDVIVDYDERTGYHRVSLRGEVLFSADGWDGAPLLPALHRTILLPPNTRASRLTVLTSDPVVVAEDVLPDFIRGEDWDGEQNPDDRDPTYYEEGAVFPPDPGFLAGNGSFRGLCLGDVAAMPFEWDSASGDLILYRQVEPLPEISSSTDRSSRFRNVLCASRARQARAEPEDREDPLESEEEPWQSSRTYGA